jgi:hypothetical protein
MYFFEDDNLDEFWMNIIDTKNPQQNQMEDDHFLNQPPTSRVKIEGKETPTTSQSWAFADLPPEMRTTEDMLDLSLDSLFIDNPPQSPMVSPKEMKNEIPKLVIPTDLPPKKEETSPKKDPTLEFFTKLIISSQTLQTTQTQTPQKTFDEMIEEKKKNGKSINVSRERKKAKKIQLQEDLANLKIEHQELEKKHLVEQSKNLILREEYLNLYNLIQSIPNINELIKKICVSNDTQNK